MMKQYVMHKNHNSCFHIFGFNETWYTHNAREMMCHAKEP